MKNMRTLQKRIAYQLQQGSPDAEVTGTTCDSRKVQPQNVFVCIRGNRMDGHVYAEEAVERGAAVLVAERELEGIPEKVTVLVVKDSREALAQLSCAWEDDPAQHLVTIDRHEGKDDDCIYDLRNPAKSRDPRRTHRNDRDEDRGKKHSVRKYNAGACCAAEAVF